MKQIFVVAALLAVLSWGLSSLAQGSNDYVVIVNANNPISEISKTDLSSFLLKKKSKWDHGVAVDPADLDAASSVRAAFSEDVHGRSVASIKNYWQRQIFSGRGVPPPEVADEQAMIDHVKASAGGIGYVSPGAQLSQTVKRVRVVG